MGNGRQLAGLAILFGGWLLIYAVWGLTAVFGAFLGTSVLIVALGVASGYWIGDSEADTMVTDLMRWRANAKAQKRDQAE